jgi:hypothetical protein
VTDTVAVSPVAATGAEGGADDLRLLRQYEPILRFTHGELFFPMPAERYLESAALLAGSTAQELRVVIPAGELNEAALVAEGETDQDAIRFLRFVQAPMNPIEIARFNQRPDRDAFEAPGRLARVGILARVLDAALVASLLVRGKVPGGTAAAAKLKYDGLRRADPRVSYHGRVSRRGGWVFLQYLFFYPMNDWRSTFDGANDHEADWEQAFVILEELPDGSTRPIWFAAAAHDEHGADLRRRWDDPKLQKDGDHVIVFPGAGSHATYMERGEYIMRLPLPGEQLLHGVLDVVRRMWRDTLNQPDPGDLAEALKRLVSVPFVDYARGDGLTVGPGQEVEWSPIIISDATPWVDGYRGLWGLDTGDRLAGERAPAGPKYTRTGSVRQSWNDPLGFVGLASAATPAETREELVARIATLEAERAAVIEEADALSAVLPGMGIEVRALAGTSGVQAYLERRALEVKASEARLASLRSSSAELKAAIAAARGFLVRYDAGYRGDPRSHLSHAAVPERPDTTNRRVFAETWAALSVGVLVLALAVILWFRLLPIAPTILLLVIGYLAIESFAQRRVETLLLRITVILAAIASILLAFHYLRELLLVGLGALGLFILVDNTGEILRARRGRRTHDVATVLDAAGPVAWDDPQPVDGPLPDEAPQSDLPEPPLEDRTTVMPADAGVAEDEVRQDAEPRA